MADQNSYSAAEMSRLGTSGMSRNVGYGINKVFAAELLSTLTRSKSLIGLILGVEGLFGVVVNPLFGHLSDRYTSRFGRHRLYVLLSTPIAGLLWLGFTYAKTFDLAVVFLVTFYLMQQVPLSPYQAWMPTIIEPKDWGRASGVLNLWWQLGNLLAFLPIPLIWEFFHSAAFWVSAIIMIAGGLIAGLTVRDTTVKPVRFAQAGPGARRRFNANLRKYFVGQMLWWLAFEAIASFFTLFVIHSLHGSVIDSALGMSSFTISATLVATAFGKKYKENSSRNLLVVLLIGFGLSAFFGLFVHSVYPAFVLLFLSGIFWGGIQVVSYPWGSELLRQASRGMTEPNSDFGLLYGIINFAQSLGLLVAAPITGAVISLSHGSYSSMFWVSVASSFAAAASIALVTNDQTSAVGDVLSPDE